MKDRFPHIFLALAVAAVMTPMLFAQEGYYGQQTYPAASQEQPATNSSPALIIEQQKPPEIKLTEPTRIGDLTLTPGYYVLQYRVHGSNHYIHITKEVTVMEVHPETSMNTYTEDVGDVRCQLEPLNHLAKTTAVKEVQEAKEARITELEIKGTALDHIL